MNIIVRTASAADLPWVIEADRDFPHPWDSDAWRNLAPHMHLFVLEQEQQLIGYALFQHISGDEQAHLLKIYLLPTTRHRGMSKILFDESRASLAVKEVFLEVGESNVAAQRFYEKMGFNRIHLAKAFYSDGENAWLMLLTR